MIIRWMTEDGSRKWIYPVKKDLNEGKKIVKQVTKKAKVIGITKVNIPSPMHPAIPYYILLLEDEHGNRLPKKTMKPWKIGDTYELTPAESEHAVVITKVKYDVEEYLKETLRLVGKSGIESGDKVFIKPSIVEPAYPYQASTTSAELVGYLITWLKGMGVTDIVVGEQAAPGNDTMAAAKKSGVLSVCQKQEVPFVDLSKGEFEEKSEDGFTFNITKELEGRKLITVPALKTSSQIGVCGAVENLSRLVDQGTLKKMYDEDIEKTLPSLLKVLPSGLHIGDGLIGLHHNGPLVAGGEPAFLNLLLASRDAVALDTVFSHIGEFAFPTYLVEAGSRGLGKNDIKQIEIIGDELRATKFPLKAAKAQPLIHPYIRLIDGKADPATFVAATKLGAKLTGLDGEEVQLVIGRHLTKDMLAGKDRLVAFGDDSISKLKELGANIIAELPDSMDPVERMMLLKSIVEDPDKKKLGIADRMRSKFASMASKMGGA